MTTRYLFVIVFGLAETMVLAEANLTAQAPKGAARVSVDSTHRGYDMEVLTDGKWVELGKETTQEHSHRDRLGNCGNSWVSAAVEGVEHWVRLDWPDPVELSQVSVWWTKPDWYPRAFRVEYLSDQSWVPVAGATDWFVPTAQRSVVTFSPLRVHALRVVQHANGGPDRGLFAVQEVGAFRDVGTPGVEGARVLSAHELRALRPIQLDRDLSRLHVRQPGAVLALQWLRSGDIVPASGLNDGDKGEAVRLHRDAFAYGVKWPIQHVLDGVVLHFANPLPAKARAETEIFDGEKWVTLRPKTKTLDEGRTQLTLVFEPTATIGLRFRTSPTAPPPVELEVHRYLPEAPNVWPERLVEGNQFEKELLASGREPSFAELSTAALSMRPARALLGLKDHPREIGIAWDGRLFTEHLLRFSFGEEAETLRHYHDTVTWKLLDGWRPGVEVRARMRDLRVRETAFVSFAGRDRTRPALFVRIELENLGQASRQTSVNVHLAGDGSRAVAGGIVSANGKLLLIGPSEVAASDLATVAYPVSVAAGQSVTVDLVQPFGETPAADAADAYREVPFDDALSDFVSYWDEILRGSTKLALPEARIENLYRAVLAQLFINADGNVMPYGSAPSAYDGNLYGVEEGFAMMALAGFRRAGDAQRYLDGTYLTPRFLVKVAKYTKYADRHQQYRNGLQPWYAVNAYRLSRDRAWIEKHLDLLRECAEWTIRERRKTMQLEEGEKPLHYGLLPKWSYGGDLSELQCYALYANFACWKGLVETAWLLRDLGDTETAARYEAEAADYRACLDRAVEGNFRADHDPPFLPLQLYAEKPVGNDYEQLFEGVLLDLHPFDPNGRHVRYLTDFLEQDNRTFCLLPRFRRDVGPGGLDGLYGLGYILTKLQQDRIDEFLLGFYGYLAFNLERDTFAARETNLLYTSDLHVHSKYPVPDASDPVPCSAAVALLLLRHLLVTEELSDPAQSPDSLRVLSGAPRAWFEDGKTIRFERAPTHFGELSCQVVSHAAKGRIEAMVKPPRRNEWKCLKLRLRHPGAKPFRQVTVNGRPWHDVDKERELVLLQPGPRVQRVVATY